MADAVKQKMPNPWFRAQSFAVPVGGRIGKSPDRPLAEGETLLGSFILPPFQRAAVWTRAQQVRLIESMWSGLPIGAYVVNRTRYLHKADEWLLDGQQRWRAILSYASNEFPVFGYRYDELTIIDHRKFEMGVVFTEMQTRLETEAECREVYERLAYGGTPHA